ncbi:MAG: hypothetical protein A2V70_04495 [Planctomycetes bacterium RBG_13_63_9]|nr:MAG: hypothetical protein A2V70_04495 [Planctomycetes bacterium RBG_13_63_9]
MHDAPRWKRALLAAVTALRRVTTRLPHRALAWLCYPIALGAWLAFVLPYRWLSRFQQTRRVARTLPLTQYAQYPFGVLLNDQFDRFSAPLERRCSSDQLRTWLEQAHLEEITVRPHWGWVAHGRKSAQTSGGEPKVILGSTRERSPLSDPPASLGSPQAWTERMKEPSQCAE